MKDEVISSSSDFTKFVEFHGHTCPGLGIGFQAARILMELLNVRKAPDEELLAIVETDACGADAIQVMTGCTFGKGNFVFKNYGKHAFSLIPIFYSCKNNIMLLQIDRRVLRVLGTTDGSLKNL
jgi:formylmethanofuran dehydrogenase subunit E